MSDNSTEISQSKDLINSVTGEDCIDANENKDEQISGKRCRASKDAVENQNA